MRQPTQSTHPVAHTVADRETGRCFIELCCQPARTKFYLVQSASVARVRDAYADPIIYEFYYSDNKRHLSKPLDKWMKVILAVVMASVNMFFKFQVVVELYCARFDCV